MPGLGDGEDGSNSLRSSLHSAETGRKVAALAGDDNELVTRAESEEASAVCRPRARVAVVVHRSLPSQLEQAGAGRGDRGAVARRVLRRLLEHIRPSHKPCCGQQSGELYSIVAGFLDHHFSGVGLRISGHVEAVRPIRLGLSAAGKGDLLVVLADGTPIRRDPVGDCVREGKSVGAHGTLNH